MADSTATNINISYQLSRNDWYWATVAIALRGIGKLWLLVWSGAVLLFVCLISGSSPNGSPVSAAREVWWVFLIYPIAVVVQCCVTTYFTSRNTYKNSVSLKGTMHYSFYDAGVTVESVTGRAELRWPAYLKVRESRHWFLLYTQRKLANPVPKRAFGSENEIVEFRELLRRHVQKVSLRS